MTRYSKPFIVSVQTFSCEYTHTHTHTEFSIYFLHQVELYHIQFYKLVFLNLIYNLSSKKFYVQ